MQDPQGESSKSKRVGVDEQFIMFRSSPNFKGMKKFIMSKVDNTEGTSNQSSPNNQSDASASSSMETSIRIKPEVQAAVDAFESASADSAGMSVATKVEKERDEYQAAHEGESTDTFPRQDTTAMATDYESSIKDQPGKEPESSIMCRDFVRGTCKRPGTCKYAHKCDTSQLFGIYTFCRNFQNKICTLPNCKYVHASIFEEQEFYRTGKLPAHVLNQKTMPPPPPPSTPPERRNKIPANFSHPPPPITTSVEIPPSGMNCIHVTSQPGMFQEEFASQVETVDGEPNKKCRFCEINDIRVQYQRERVEKKRASVEELKRKVADVQKKKERMSATLTAVLDLMKNSPAAPGPNALFNIISNDTSKVMLEQLAKMNSNNRMSALGEDNPCTNVLGEKYNVASIIAKLLFDDQQGRKD